MLTERTFEKKICIAYINIECYIYTVLKLYLLPSSNLLIVLDANSSTRLDEFFIFLACTSKKQKKNRGRVFLIFYFFNQFQDPSWVWLSQWREGLLKRVHCHYGSIRLSCTVEREEIQSRTGLETLLKPFSAFRCYKNSSNNLNCYTYCYSISRECSISAVSLSLLANLFWNLSSLSSSSTKDSKLRQYKCLREL